jgi:hypothetical protein
MARSFYDRLLLRLAEAALHRLFATLDPLFRDDRVSGYLGLVSLARHYTPWEIACTAQLARRARMSPASPANWRSDLILAFPGDVRVELGGKARQENKDRGSTLPSSWYIAAVSRDRCDQVLTATRTVGMGGAEAERAPGMEADRDSGNFRTGGRARRCRRR